MDLHDADNIIAVFSNYHVQSIFHSTNGGITWEAVSGNLEDQPDGGGAGPSVRWVKMLHLNNETIYFAATSVGLFSTTELLGRNTEWVQEGKDIIGNVIIDMIDARETDGTVVLATQGNGVYETKATIPSSVTAEKKMLFTLEQNYPNPASSYTNFDFILSEGDHVSLILTDNNGRETVLINGFRSAGDHAFKLNTRHLSAGVYIYTLSTSKGKLSRKMVVER